MSFYDYVWSFLVSKDCAAVPPVKLKPIDFPPKKYNLVWTQHDQLMRAIRKGKHLRHVRTKHEKLMIDIKIGRKLRPQTIQVYKPEPSDHEKLMMAIRKGIKLRHIDTRNKPWTPIKGMNYAAALMKNHSNDPVVLRIAASLIPYPLD